MNPSIPRSKNRAHTPGASGVPPSWHPKATTLERLAGELGVTPEDLRDTYVAPFRDLAVSRGFMYRDWDKGFSNCVRLDWLALRAP